MLNNPVINLILLLSFVYFISSLMVSSIQEVIAAARNLRRRLLLEAINNLFFENEGARVGATGGARTGPDGKPLPEPLGWKTFVEEKLNNSPHIMALKRNAKRNPAYIPARNFALAVLGECGFTASIINSSPQETMKALEQKVSESCLPDNMKMVLQGIILQTDGKVEKLQEGLESFYNRSMERIGDWYKAHVRWWIFCISLVFCTALNIDTIKISADALRNPDALAQRADLIQKNMGRFVRIDSATYGVVYGTDTMRIGALTVAGGVRKLEDSAAYNKLMGERAELEQLRMLSAEVGLPMGYKNGWNGFKAEWWGNPDENAQVKVGRSLAKLFGIVLTCFALLLGSNYWFDLMNRVVNIRAAGKKPEPNEKDDLRGK